MAAQCCNDRLRRRHRSRRCRPCLVRMAVGARAHLGSRRRALLRWVQIALKPASKTFGLHGVFIRGKGLKYMIADSAFKRMQVDARACWLDTGEPHRGLALRTSGALNCNEWNDGRRVLRSSHGCFPGIGGSATLSVTGNAWGGGAVIA